jgi:hypothetical protein
LPKVFVQKFVAPAPVLNENRLDPFL